MIGSYIYSLIYKFAIKKKYINIYSINSVYVHTDSKDVEGNEKRFFFLKLFVVWEKMKKSVQFALTQ